MYSPPRASSLKEFLEKQHVSIYVDPKERNVMKVLSEINGITIPGWIQKTVVELLKKVTARERYPITKKSVLAAVYLTAIYEYPALAYVIENMPCLDTDTPCYKSKKNADPEFKKYYMILQPIVAELWGPPPRTSNFITYVVKKYSLPVPLSTLEKAQEIYRRAISSGAVSGHKTTTTAVAVLSLAIEETLHDDSVAEELMDVIMKTLNASKNSVSNLVEKLRECCLS